MYVFYTCMYFWSCERAAKIHRYANVSFPLILREIGRKNKINRKNTLIIHILRQTRHEEAIFTHIKFLQKY